MKKVIIAVAALVCSLGFMVSCGDTKTCWEITETYSILGVSQSATVYVFGTRNDVDAAIADAEKELNSLGVGELKITKKHVSKSQSDCEAMNNK